MAGYARERSAEANRLGLGVAVVLTVAAIAAGTWALGSGADPVERDQVPALTDVAPAGARPPLAVAPPPDDADQRASRKANRSDR